MRLIVLVVSLLLVSGCTTASQVMQSYVGKDIKEAILDYGQPSMVMDLEKGKRAYQWAMTDGRVYGGVSNTYGNVSAFGNTANVNSTTVSTPAYYKESTCLYSVYAEKLGKDKWIITGFRKPQFACE